MNKNIIQRFWEIDLLRGIAIIMMIIFHFLYDLNFFGIYKISLYTGYWLIYAYIGGVIFFSLVGISLSLSYNRIKNRLTKKQVITKYIQRGLKIFGLSMVITLGTWIYLINGFIVFGALHCIAVSILLSYPFLKLRYPNLILGIILILCGIILKNFSFDFYWLLWLGFSPSTFYTVDYYPILPWFGVVLLGIFVGNVLYPEYKRKFRLKNLSYLRITKILSFLGRHSLVIYLIHQPIMIGIIHLLLYLI